MRIPVIYECEEIGAYDFEPSPDSEAIWIPVIGDIDVAQVRLLIKRTASGTYFLVESPEVAAILRRCFQGDRRQDSHRVH